MNEKQCQYCNRPSSTGVIVKNWGHGFSGCEQCFIAWHNNQIFVPNNTTKKAIKELEEMK